MFRVTSCAQALELKKAEARIEKTTGSFMVHSILLGGEIQSNIQGLSLLVREFEFLDPDADIVVVFTCEIAQHELPMK